MEVKMWFWWTMLVCDLIIPLMMIIAGWMMWKHTPMHINRWYGYRTALSMKNEQTWKFAHMYAGRLWCIMGIVLLIPSVLIWIPFHQSSATVVGIVGLVVTMPTSTEYPRRTNSLKITFSMICDISFCLNEIFALRMPVSIA